MPINYSLDLTKQPAKNNMDKKLVGLGVLIGSTIGSYVPTWFGAGYFSFYSILGAFVGGILGIWAAFRFSD